MIPTIFLLQPALPWLLAARCAVAYWQTVAEAWAMINMLTASADVVAFPRAALPRRSSDAQPSSQGAEILRFTPASR